MLNLQRAPFSANRAAAPLGAVALLSCLALAAPGCGGNSNNGANINTATASLRLTINWPALETETQTASSTVSRAVAAPSAARSVAIALSAANPDGGGPYNLPVINRTDAAAAYSQAYISPSAVRIGPTRINLRFYAEKDGKNAAGLPGTAVGDATADVVIANDGTINDNILVVPSPATPTPTPSPTPTPTS